MAATPKFWKPGTDSTRFLLSAGDPCSVCLPLTYVPKQSMALRTHFNKVIAGGPAGECITLQPGSTLV